MTTPIINIRIVPWYSSNVGTCHEQALYSVEFQYADATTLTFGTSYTECKFTDVPIDTQGGEKVTGFIVRAGEWIDAIKVVTNRKHSAWMGNIDGSKTFELVPPQGYELIGIFGRFGQCIDGFGVVYTSNT